MHPPPPSPSPPPYPPGGITSFLGCQVYKTNATCGNTYGGTQKVCDQAPCFGNEKQDTPTPEACFNAAVRKRAAAQANGGVNWAKSTCGSPYSLANNDGPGSGGAIIQWDPVTSECGCAFGTTHANCVGSPTTLPTALYYCRMTEYPPSPSPPPAPPRAPPPSPPQPEAPPPSPPLPSPPPPSPPSSPPPQSPCAPTMVLCTPTTAGCSDCTHVETPTAPFPYAKLHPTAAQSRQCDPVGANPGYCVIGNTKCYYEVCLFAAPPSASKPPLPVPQRSPPPPGRSPPPPTPTRAPPPPKPIPAPATHQHTPGRHRHNPMHQHFPTHRHFTHKHFVPHQHTPAHKHSTQPHFHFAKSGFGPSALNQETADQSAGSPTGTGAAIAVGAVAGCLALVAAAALLVSRQRARHAPARSVRQLDEVAVEVQ